MHIVICDPGIVDTDMQKIIRSVDENLFPEKQKPLLIACQNLAKLDFLFKTIPGFFQIDNLWPLQLVQNMA